MNPYRKRQIRRDLVESRPIPPPTEPHASDCNVWVNEPCNCIMGKDPDLLIDKYKEDE